VDSAAFWARVRRLANFIAPELTFSRESLFSPHCLFAENPDGRLKGRHWLIPTPSLRNEANKLAVLSIQSMIELEFRQQGILKAPEAAGQKRLVENRARMGITSLN
jgi:hypothetical protein